MRYTTKQCGIALRQVAGRRTPDGLAQDREQAVCRASALSKEFLARLKEAYQRPRQGHLVRSFRAQLKAIHRWGQQTLADLAGIDQPVLVMNVDSDKDGAH